MTALRQEIEAKKVVRAQKKQNSPSQPAQRASQPVPKQQTKSQRSDFRSAQQPNAAENHEVCFECGCEGHYKLQCPALPCFECKSIGHSKAACPQVICFYCHTKGHIKRTCQKLRRRKGHRHSQASNPSGATRDARSQSRPCPANLQHERSNTAVSFYAPVSQHPNQVTPECPASSHDTAEELPTAESFPVDPEWVPTLVWCAEIQQLMDNR